MASRNIAITEDLYDALSRRKRPDESFTKVIYRLLRDKERPEDYLGAWGDLTEEEIEGIVRSRKDLRDRWTKREPEE